MTARHSNFLIGQNETLHLAVKVMMMGRSEGTYQSYFFAHANEGGFSNTVV